MIFVGDGPLKREIKDSLGDAFLAGFLNGDELSRAYASADLFVFPSTTESFGNVVLEAGASGLPSVVAAEGGVVDIVRDGETGFLSRSNDPLDFAAKMETILTNKLLRDSMSARAVEEALKRSWTRVNGKLLENYIEIVDSHKAKQFGKILTQKNVSCTDPADAN
jgi:glycosyltransferase involved in cell wall biosynthesis